MGRKSVSNKITTPELLSQVCDENKQLEQEVLLYWETIQLAESTIKVYKNDIEIVWVWNLQNNKNKPFVEWKTRDVINLQNWLIYTNQNSAKRVKRIKSVLSSMSDYIETVCEEDYPNFRNIMHKVKNPASEDVREKTVWEEAELQELLDKVVEMKQYELACFLALGMFSGRRKAELCRFRMTDFDDDKLVCGGALYKSEPLKTKGRGKGKFIPCYTLAKKFKPYLDLWLKERKEKGIDSPWLFPSTLNPENHAPVSQADSWARRLDKLSDKPFYNHSLRHYFTTQLYKAGLPESVVQALQGWSDIQMVSVYLDLDTDEQIEMYFKDGEIVAPQRKGLSDL